MNATLIATDFVAALFIIVIIIGLYEVPKEVLKPTRLFRICMWFVFVGLGIEMLIYILDGNKNLSVLNLILAFTGYALVDLLTMTYSYYIYYLVEESVRHITKKMAYVVTVLCSIDILFYIIGTITGKLFTISNGYFTPGPWHAYRGTFCSLSFLLMCVFYIFKYRSFRIRSKFFVVLIVAVPLMATVMLHVDSNVGFGYLGAAISMNVVYAVLESKIIAEAVADAKMYSEISENDMLTGLKNRRAYQMIINRCMDEKLVGVAFADVNSLKAVNDNQGHEAGDRLIQKVANLLKDAVPEGTVCRISGDEFVCIVKDAGIEAFTETMKKLGVILKENDRIASLGYDIGEGKDIYDIIKAAEKMMYSDKERYYKETGKDRRR
jgi:diguanylate cyclase (GGDEF)-like protein